MSQELSSEIKIEKLLTTMFEMACDYCPERFKKGDLGAMMMYDLSQRKLGMRDVGFAHAHHFDTETLIRHVIHTYSSDFLNEMIEALLDCLEIPYAVNHNKKRTLNSALHLVYSWLNDKPTNKLSLKVLVIKTLSFDNRYFNIRTEKKLIAQLPWVYLLWLKQPTEDADGYIFDDEFDEEADFLHYVPEAVLRNLRFLSLLLSRQTMVNYHIDFIPKDVFVAHPELLLSIQQPDDNFLFYMPEEVIRNNLNVVKHAINLNGKNIESVPLDMQQQHPDLVIAAIKNGGLNSVKDFSRVSQELILDNIPDNIDKVPAEIKTVEFYRRFAMKWFQENSPSHIWTSIPADVLLANPDIVRDVILKNPKFIKDVPSIVLSTYPELKSMAHHQMMRMKAIKK